MHQLGLTAADVAVHLEQEAAAWEAKLRKFEQAAMHGGMPEERAREWARIQYLHEFAATLLEMNNRKLAADLVRLGVITGTIRKTGEASF